MGLLHLVVAALAASAVAAADPPCACVNETQILDSITNPLIFFQQPTNGGLMNGKTCTMNCNFVAKMDKDDENYFLQIQILSTNKLGDGSLTVGGMNDTITIVSTTPTGMPYAASYGDSITIDFTESANNVGEFMLVVQKTFGQRPAKKDPKTTTLAPPTPPYDKKFTNNPLRVANDIMFAFDLSSNNIAEYKKFATSIINELSINPKLLSTEDPEDCGAGSRLSIVGLSGLAFDNLYAPHWTTTGKQAVGNIESMVQIGNAPFKISPVKEKYIQGFEDNKDITTCKNRGKIFIMLSSVSPFESAAPPTPEAIPFLANGVHQILVKFNSSLGADSYYTNNNTYPGDSRWNIFELSNTDKDIESFMNKYLVDSTADMTCQPASYTEKIGDAAVTVSIPPYYKGQTGAANEDRKTWDKPQHYCNFQETKISLIAAEGVEPKQRICITVYYDLETNKDYVSINQKNPTTNEVTEVVRLTGRDVSGTTFELDYPVGSIEFLSDEKNVYDGFYAKITKCAT